MKGQGFPIYIPIMGIGLSRAWLSHEQALQKLISVLKLESHKIHGSVNIVVFKNDKDKVSIWIWLKYIIEGVLKKAYRKGNYTAFYVDEPFEEGNLGANSTRDFVYYNMLRMWKAQDGSFSFIDSHDKTYNVRDGSDWEKPLKPRFFNPLLIPLWL